MGWWNEILPDVLNMLTARLDSDDPPGTTTGMKVLDERLGGGWIRQQLSYLVGESGVGKSWLVSWWILTAAKWLKNNRPLSGYIISGKSSELDEIVEEKENKPPIVIFWSLEMSESPVSFRLLTQLAYQELGEQLDSKKLMSGDLTEQELTGIIRKAYEEVEMNLNNLYMAFDCNTIEGMRDIMEELSYSYDICFMVVDYFRLIDVYAESIPEAQSMRSRGLKSLANQFDCHVLSVFDVTREGEKADSLGLAHMKGGTAARYDSDLSMTLTEKGENSDNQSHLLLTVKKGRFVSSSTTNLKLYKDSGVVELYGQQEKQEEERVRQRIHKRGLEQNG